MRNRTAAATELPLLRDIERVAGQLFAEFGMPEVAAYDPQPLAELAAAREAGHLWVAADDADAPVAYLVAAVVDGNLHIEQVSVHPDHARRGIGRGLLAHAAEQARVRSLPALTLTTFLDVPWNAPYYRRCGFRPLAAAEETPGLRAIRDGEAALGLDRWPRLCMRRDCP
jgi:GNAT superfamily N-acetyltransferase